MIPDQISTRLLKGENVLWWGRPAQGIMLTARDGVLIPFSLFWIVFTIVWESSALKSPAPFPFALFGLPLVLGGLFLIFGRFLLDSWLRSRMVYALTDRRVLIARSPPWPSFKSVNLDRLPEATLNEGANGRGTIRFGLQGPMWGRMGNGGTLGAWVASLDPTPQFLGIDDVQRVFAAVQERSQGRI